MEEREGVLRLSPREEATIDVVREYVEESQHAGGFWEAPLTPVELVGDMMVYGECSGRPLHRPSVEALVGRLN
jgi:hypothetical protein